MLMPFCPVDVQILPDGNAAAAALRARMEPEQAILLLASDGRFKALGLGLLADALRADGHRVLRYADIAPNPALADVAKLLSFLATGAFTPTAVVAVGGGSCIDLGKAACALCGLPPAHTPAAVREALRPRAYERPPPRPGLYALPTTAGTGSEVTRWATLWDPEETKKLSLDDAGGFPKAALLVPEWTRGMGAELTLATGLDALSHAMEAYWAVAREPLSQELALAAAAKIRDALPLALADAGAPAPRRELAMGSLLAGLAFSRTRTTACHSISYPLTLLFGVPHGFAAAVTLSSVLRCNRAAVPELNRLDALFEEYEGFDAWMERVSLACARCGCPPSGSPRATCPRSATWRARRAAWTTIPWRLRRTSCW
jgi:alcohol dehydrogenase class IV